MCKTQQVKGGKFLMADRRIKLPIIGNKESENLTQYFSSTEKTQFSAQSTY